jgi:hypothetical protein
VPRMVDLELAVEVEAPVQISLLARISQLVPAVDKAPENKFSIPIHLFKYLRLDCTL